MADKYIVEAPVVEAVVVTAPEVHYVYPGDVRSEASAA